MKFRRSHPPVTLPSIMLIQYNHSQLQFFKRLKIGPSCAFMKSVYIQLWPIKCLCSRTFCINATPLPLAGISFRLLLPFKGGVHWYWKSQFFCKHNYFLSYSQLFQISQIFENVFRKLPDCVVLQPSDEKNNTAMIGKCFHIFLLWWVFETNFKNTILVIILTYWLFVKADFW